MKEYKFRAWDKKGGRWIHHEESGLLFLNFETTGGGVFHLHDVSATGKDYYEIMQYTGLKDKNGVDIYAGDRIRWIGNDGYDRDGVVAWSNGDLAWIACDEWLLCEAYNLVVIGNIHENPELIKEKP